ncbi:MAG: mono/diheme cytochrome c family protein [Mariniblastus sp.]|jgi:mono/diheme cytochrome c family protein
MGVEMTKQAIMVVLLSLWLVSAAVAASDFVRDVQPILQKHCYGCHGEQKQKSGLRLDIKSEAFKGGELYGPSLIAGNSAESPLVQFVSDRDADLPMPPEGDGLSAAEIATLTRWVDNGAHWPDGVDQAKLKDLRDHWSFQPLTNPDLPLIRNENWVQRDIDRFVLAKLESTGLKPAGPADRASWLRRVSLDLVGIPPTLEQVTAFVNETNPDAYANVIDELLASSRYGERWAQHWLDVVRYADTHGFEVNTERGNAWPYRDYVIRALNDDTPYDQFVQEQLVGDAMGQDAALGFLVTASVLLPGQIGKDAPSMRLARQDSIDEMVINVGQTFLGLSIGCARCHDHKFDPVPQRDYFAMQAFLAGVHYGEREIVTPESVALREKSAKAKRRVTEIDHALARFEPSANSGVERAMIKASQNTDRFAPIETTQIRFTIRSTNKLEPCLDEIEVFNLEGENVALANHGTMVESSGDQVSPNRHELRLVNDGRYGNSHSWMSSKVGQGWLVLTFSEKQEIDCVRWGRDRLGKFKDRLATDYSIEVQGEDGVWKTVADAADRKPFDESVASNPPGPAQEPAEKQGFSLDHLSPSDAQSVRKLIAEKSILESIIIDTASPQKVFAGVFRKPDTIHLLSRGDPEMPKDVVSPAVPTALGEVSLPSDADEQTRRKVLAEWMVDAANPLTARVMVNRIWQGHFGTGLVKTANDFGHAGEAPTHPELLDWLASEFIRSGWSIKHMHRLILLSATYQQASSGGDASQTMRALDVDADARLLWKFPSRRMDAETIRDSILAVSGQLDLKMFGRGYNLFDKRGGLSGFQPVEQFSGEGLRRMIYAHKIRRERDAIFGAFDCPDAGQSTPRRRESTTPIQALNLFNSRFTLDQSEVLSERVVAEVGANPVEQISRAYQLVLTRAPQDVEIQEAESVVRRHGLSVLCRVLFNSNEFLFLP